jgi:bifunctional aspartate aminotransferase and glutamate/aspartate-prephenate aminotransferase
MRIKLLPMTMMLHNNVCIMATRLFLMLVVSTTILPVACGWTTTVLPPPSASRRLSSTRISGGFCLASSSSSSSTEKEVQQESQQQQQQKHHQYSLQPLPSLNPLISKIQPSKTVEIFSRVKELQRNGVPVTSLCVGEPDFAPPRVVLDAVVQAVHDGDTRYTAVTGTAELRQAIAEDLHRRKNGLSYNANTEIVVGNGAKQCVYQGILAVAGLGDAVLIPAPYWPSYPEMALLTGATPVIVETQARDGYLLTADQLRQALQDDANANIKLLILCNPSNPTGSVYSRQQLQDLADVLLDYPQVVVLADEIYERLCYNDDDDVDGEGAGEEQESEGSCVSFASISPEMFARTITVNGFSKAYAMTGLRLGYVAAPKRIATTIATIQSQLTSCAGSLSQAAGLAALTLVDETEMAANVAIMKNKRDYVLQQLSTMQGVTVHVPPQGAFYVLPDISPYVNSDDYDDTQLCVDLLDQEQLALVPGSSFGAPGTVRISYATSMQELEIAMTKLRRFLARAKVFTPFLTEQ